MLDICTQTRAGLIWQARKLSPATKPYGGEIYHSLVQPSARRACLHMHTGVCMHMSNDDVSVSFLKAYGKSLQLGPLRAPAHRQRGKAMSQLSNLREDKFTQKCPHWSFSGVFAFLQGEPAGGCAVRRGSFVGQPFARFGRFWWIPLNRLSSSCFCSVPAHFTHWQATLCFRREGERVWQDGGWASSVCVCVRMSAFMY